MTKTIYITADESTSCNHRLAPEGDLTTVADPAEVGNSNLAPATTARPTIERTTSPKETISIIVSSVGRGRFAAFLDGHMLCVSETPLLAAARVLQAQGVSATTRLEMAHEGSATVAMHSTVGAAAGYRVSETGSMPRFVPWRPDRLPCNSGFPCTVDEPDG
ncbi:hypothetical protein KBI52_29670 [Microvirga sp. HBU67558]|uniref:hypothetical protein n=1 Tax=Microvirga TaxID=186650 RepID=UPI001B37B484|nr:MULTISPECIES: hypothetical protein [unclassified Microvirga]MBQ0824369.1 hypothetical protein [Microvirga sp. HBU67558]